MQNASEIPIKKEIIVKRISASKFEVYHGTPPPSSEKPEEKPKEEEQAPPAIMRQSVIQKAPPAPWASKEVNKREELPASKRRKTDGDEGPTGVIFIKDAIVYRIVDILMWKVMGENQLRMYGYPSAPTHQLLWRIVYHNCFLSKTKTLPGEHLNQDHDCGGSMPCFTNHVHQFLEMCAPNLWKRTGWGKLCMEEVLRRIYYEDLIPYLRSVDLRNNLNVLKCHSDIVLLEKWEKQKFTAVTWSGQKHFSQMSVNCPKCPQCIVVLGFPHFPHGLHGAHFCFSDFNEQGFDPVNYHSKDESEQN